MRTTRHSRLIALLPPFVAWACGGESSGGGVQLGGGTSWVGGNAQVAGAAGDAGSGGNATGSFGGTTGAGGSQAAGGSAANSGSGGATAYRSCEEIQGDYEIALEQALACAPAMSSPQCTEIVPLGLLCMCDGAVNARQPDAIAQIAALQAEYNSGPCGTVSVNCGACMDVQGGGCSIDGECVTYGPD